MNPAKVICISAVSLAIMSSTALAGVADPDCTPEKAAKSAAAKSTVGVGGRCNAGEAAKDSGKKAAGIDDKGPLEKKKNKNDTPVEKAKDAIKN